MMMVDRNPTDFVAIEKPISRLMSNLNFLIKNHSVKYDRKIKSICAPLATCLDIPIFTYAYVEADGNFGYLTNAIGFNEYYFDKKLYLQNPYFSHPALFRSGYALLPCTIDEETKNTLRKNFSADHFFLHLHATPTRMEFFIFANENVSFAGNPRYMTQLNLLTKFERYFKREAHDIIGKMNIDQYNVRNLIGDQKFQNPTQVPLLNKDPKIHSFLKQISGLTPQELRCLELFKEGKSAQATGAIMGISQRTVEHYFENIKDKLGYTSKYDLLNY